MIARLLAGTALLLLGCTAPADRPAAPAPAEATRTADAPPATPPADAKPTPPPPTDAPPAATPPAPPTGEPPVEWWCTCYYKYGDGDPEPLTACRTRKSDCDALERGVMKGKPGIVFASVTHPCQAITAAHPGDLHGGRDAWEPSKKAGSWLSPGACQLPGPGKQVDLGARPKEAEDILDLETLGELKLGQTEADVLAKLGEPASRGRTEMWEADGIYHQTWNYPQVGLTLDMESRTRKAARTLGSITAKAPSTLATAKGVTIGTPRAQAIKLYGALRDPEYPVDEGEQLIAGSIYGGVMFTFAGGKVTEIFFGAAAE